MVGHGRDADRQAESVDDRVIGHGKTVGPHRGRQSLADLSAFFPAVARKQQEESTVGLRQHDVIPTKQRDEESADAGRHSIRGATTRFLGQPIEVVELSNQHRGVPERRCSAQQRTGNVIKRFAGG